MCVLKFQILVSRDDVPPPDASFLGVHGCRLDDTGSCVTGTVRVLHVRVLLTTGSRRHNALHGTHLVLSMRSHVFCKSRTRSSTIMKTVKRSILSHKAWMSKQGRVTSSTGLVGSATRTMRRWVLIDPWYLIALTLSVQNAIHSPRFSNRGGALTVGTLF